MKQTRISPHFWPNCAKYSTIHRIKHGGTEKDQRRGNDMKLFSIMLVRPEGSTVLEWHQATRQLSPREAAGPGARWLLRSWGDLLSYVPLQQNCDEICVACKLNYSYFIRLKKKNIYIFMENIVLLAFQNNYFFSLTYVT